MVDIHLFCDVSVVILVHGSEYLVYVSLLAQELLEGQLAVVVLVENLEKSIHLSPEDGKCV